MEKKNAQGITSQSGYGKTTTAYKLINKVKQDNQYQNTIINRNVMSA